MRVIFMGSADVSCVMLDALLATPGVSVVGVVTQPDRPVGRNRRMTPCPCCELAVKRALPVIKPEKINAAESLAQLEAWAADVIVVVAYGQFLGKKLLVMPQLGCVNIHLSLLPRHRGAAPVQWAIMAGDAASGVTAMLMDAGMDSGDILEQVSEPIRADDTAESLYDRLSPLGAKLLVRTLADLGAGRATRTPQDATAVTFAAKLCKENGRISWNLTAVEIERRVRGLFPWPGCFTTMPRQPDSTGEAERVKILRVAVQDSSARAAAGTVLENNDTGPLVQTGRGALRLLDVQPEGGKPMNAAAFLRGHPLQVGDVLGKE
jgi:methionyl-tRNA formyltransferase